MHAITFSPASSAMRHLAATSWLLSFAAEAGKWGAGQMPDAMGTKRSAGGPDVWAGLGRHGTGAASPTTLRLSECPTMTQGMPASLSMSADTSPVNAPWPRELLRGGDGGGAL